MQFLGNKEILKHPKTAFISSQKCPANAILKSYDWAKRQRAEENCIVCSNHSPIEKDVFEILIRGKQPLILVLPRSMKKRWEPEIETALSKNRLLIISPFAHGEATRITRDTAVPKNKTIIEISDNVVVGYKTPGGQLDDLLRGVEFLVL